MSNRWLRFGIALLAIGAAGAAGYRIFQQEQRLAVDAASAESVRSAAEVAQVNLAELQAALHAYVAEGQGDAFWTARAALLIEHLHTTILELDPAATAAGAPLSDTLDQIDRLAAAEQRAREHVQQGQRLLAGEVIFTEARDLIDGIRDQVVAARTQVVASAGHAQAEVQRARTMLSLAAGGVLAFATLLLVIPGTSASPTTAAAGPAQAPERPSDGSGATTPSASPAAAEGLATPARATGGTRPPTVAPAPALAAAESIRVADRKAAAAPSVPPAPSVSLREAAAVCTDFGRVSQSIELGGLLQRAANVLGATGAVVWIATPDREELYAAASAGYDDRLIARIGTIARGASNVTAAAFRDAAARTSARAGLSSASLAVPLMTPLGPVGVFTAEIRDVVNVDETRLAVASIFAAQLAGLLGSMASSASPDLSASARAAGAQA